MKILLATPFNYPVGGIVKWANHIMDYHKSLGDVNKVSVLPMDRKVDAASSPNVLFRLISSFFEYRKYLKEEVKLLGQSKYDVVHICSSAAFSLVKDLWMVDAAHKYGAKAIVHFHFGRIPALKQSNNGEWKRLCKVVNKADGVIVLDEMSLQTLRAEGYDNVYKLPNPVAPIVSEHAASFNGEKIKRTILFAGHGLKTKGVYELVSACKRIPNVKVKMAGEIADSIKQELEELADHKEWLNVVGNLSFEQVLNDMSSCDLFVLPTYTEGFPNVILEAMACGCAIVTTPVGAIPEMLQEDDNGQYGILVQPQDADALYQGLVSVLDDEEFKSKIRKNAKRKVEEKYNIQSVWNQLTEIWNNVAPKK